MTEVTGEGPAAGPCPTQGPEAPNPLTRLVMRQQLEPRPQQGSGLAEGSTDLGAPRPPRDRGGSFFQRRRFFRLSSTWNRSHAPQSVSAPPWFLELSSLGTELHPHDASAWTGASALTQRSPGPGPAAAGQGSSDSRAALHLPCPQDLGAACQGLSVEAGECSGY